MQMCIGHQSALEYWNVSFRQLGVSQGLKTLTERRADTKEACAALARGDVPRLSETNHRPRGVTVPVHATVTSLNARTHAKNLVVHLRSAPIPATAFVKIDNEFFVSTPEFAFTQLADELSLIGLVELGFELCGTYSLRPDGTLQSNCPPLSSADKLRRFIDKAPGFRGRKKALRALQYVLDGSASPRETQLAMLLCLPYALGGYKLPSPELNRRIEVPDKRAGRASAYCVCDLYWPEYRLDVEYDSTEYHASSEALAKDAVRRMVLEGANITSINVTNAHMRDSGLFNQLARGLARIMGKRLRYQDPEFTRAHLKLRRQLGLP